MAHEETQPAEHKAPKEKGRILSKDTNAAIREVLSTVQKLGDIYVEETDTLKNIDNTSFMALQGRKIAAAQRYQNDMGQMIARKHELKMADAAMKKALKEAQENFSVLARENLEALGRMQRCTERLGDTVRNAAIRAAQKDSGYSYGDTGTLSKAAQKKAVSSGLSETV